MRSSQFQGGAEGGAWGGAPECKDLAEVAWMRREALGFDARARSLPALAFGCSSDNPGGYTGRSGSSSPPDPRLRLGQCKKKCRFWRSLQTRESWFPDVALSSAADPSTPPPSLSGAGVRVDLLCGSEGEEAGTPASPKKIWACSSGPLIFLTQENSRPQFLRLWRESRFRPLLDWRQSSFLWKQNKTKQIALPPPTSHSMNSHWALGFCQENGEGSQLLWPRGLSAEQQLGEETYATEQWTRLAGRRTPFRAGNWALV